ncbi:serine hydrolase [Brevundimonas aurifodinae]|uniref:Serine hydrolase n=1 Tax=Brevundimonas aurifodinae TaxID=1508312 RepID=A0ABV1NL35_9CAUL
MALVAATLSGCGPAEMTNDSAAFGRVSAPAVADQKPLAAPAELNPTTVIATPAYNIADANDVGRIDVGWVKPSGGNPDRYVLLATCKTGCSTATRTTTVALPSTGVFQWGGFEATERYEITVQARYPSSGGGFTYSDPVIAQAPVTVEKRAVSTDPEQSDFRTAAEYSEARGGEVLIVVRNGRTIFRADAGANDPNPYEGGPIQLASGTKSFSCAFATAARMDQVFGNPTGDAFNQLARLWITEWRPGSPFEPEHKAEIRLRDLLMLRAGLTGADAYDARPTVVATLDTYKLAREEDVSANPPNDAYFLYDPLSFQAFANAFQIAAPNNIAPALIPGRPGDDPVNYINERVFKRIGMNVPVDQWTRDVIGSPQMAGGAVMLPEDWAKFGVMTIQNGAYGGKRILDGALMTDCVTAPNNAYSGYGVGWWLNRDSTGTYNPLQDPGMPTDGAPYPGTNNINPRAPRSMYFAAGTGKERLYVFPEENTIIVRMASVDGLLLADDWSDACFIQLAFPSAPDSNPGTSIGLCRV